jgi:hypothetical protein
MGRPALEEDIPFFERLLGLAAGVRVLETVQGRAAGQRIVFLRRHVAHRLKEGIVPQLLSVVAIKVAAQNLVYPLGQNPLAAVGDKELVPRIGQPSGRFGQHAQLPIQPPHRQQPRVADHRPTRKIDRDPLPSHLPKRKLLPGTLCRNHLGLLRASK